MFPLFRFLVSYVCLSFINFVLVSKDGFCPYYISRGINVLDFSVLEEIVVRFKGKSDLLGRGMREYEIEDESKCRR